MGLDGITVTEPGNGMDRAISVESSFLFCLHKNLFQLILKLILRCLMDTSPSPNQLASALIPRSGKANPAITASSSNMLGFIAFASMDFVIRGSIFDRKGLNETGGFGFGELGV